MTSEICVMNRHALVLAADSAATVSSWENGRKEERYFKGSNKIFQISSTEPVGAMIYDSADLQRVPWEIIVKTFRKNLGASQFSTVGEYALNFFRFIESNRSLFPEHYLRDLLIENLDQIMIRFLRMIEDDERVKSLAPDAEAMIEARRTMLNEFSAATELYELKAPFTDADIQAVRELHGERLKEEAKLDLKYFSANSPLDVEQLVELAIQAIFRRPSYFLSETGIVIAGYGTDEFFPSYKEFSCIGFIGERLCFEEKSELRISPRDSGFFKAFATTAMADTFTMGFGPDVYATVRTHLRSTLHDFAGKLKGEGDAEPEGMEQYVNDAITDHTKKWTDDVYEKHALPLRRVIGSLPLDEMASLAETLVMLESLKEKVTRPSESVSGPIDVAIITRHEGFVWAKRKLYFDPKLNSRFFLRQKADYDHLAEHDDV
ncbi:hypothetical protein AB8A28_19730 [Tardiphaga sp. 71_E8_N1_1]|uniref:hypothetical protein n=1 Tax=Tardiphaga sp. 71_E8_N1_1 TaxID=3240784 RepID=UPI003F8999C1